MIEQHLGDFVGRLRQHNLSRYDYCPIPKIHFQTLDKELYVHEYYLRNFCDEVKFKDWPVAEPLILLRETIERWRNEMTKGVVDSKIEEAEKLLGLPKKFSNPELRKAYKNLARQYHPDKNPNGRDMFEKIHVAYELLSGVELKLMETDLNDVILLVQTQNIIYKRFSNLVADQKYPAYPLLVSVLKVPQVPVTKGNNYGGQWKEGTNNDETPLSDTEFELLIHGTKLCYLTVGISPLNAKEFVRANAVPKLHDIINYGLYKNNHELLICGLKAFTAVLQFDTGLEAVAELGAPFAENMYQILLLEKTIPLAVENGIEIIARASSSSVLQTLMIEAGVTWLLMPMLLSYDNTVTGIDYSDESQRVTHNQNASNMHAILACKALGRLGGFMFEDLKSPENLYVKKALSCLLSQPLAKLLRNRRPWDLLNALNENVETPTKIWNVSMRGELVDFLARVQKLRPLGSNDDDLKAAFKFGYSALRNELCIGGVYVRMFNKGGDVADIDDPSQYCTDLIEYIHDYLHPDLRRVKTNQPLPPLEYQELSMEALKTLAETQDYIASDIAKADRGITVVFDSLSFPSESPLFMYASQLLAALASSAAFVTATVNSEPSCIWKFIRCLCETVGDSSSNIWAGAEAIASHPDGLDSLLKHGGVVHLLGCLCGIEGHSSVYATRLAAVSLLSKFLWNPVKGPEASSTLRRFLPEPIVNVLRSRAGNASLQVLDDVCENPELIWTAEMQVELREAITQLLQDANKGNEDKHNIYVNPPVINAEYAVKFAQIESELYVGGVYVRLYLKQPTFRLSNPVLFLEKLVEFWESAFNTQVPLSGTSTSRTSYNDQDAESTALVLGSEDFLSLVTSCIVCVVKGEPSVVDHLLAWGFTHSLCDFIKRCHESNRRGTPITCIIRLLSQLVYRVDAVDTLANASVDIISQLVITLGGTGFRTSSDGSENSKINLPKEAAFVVELLKKIFSSKTSAFLPHFVTMANQADLANFLLDHVIGANQRELEEVRNPAALRIHAVDTIKAIIAADEFQAGPLQTLLDHHPVWAEYRDQSHDLFITDQEKTDPFLIQDSTDKAIAGLLTDGNVKASISTYFTSTGVLPTAANGNDKEITRTQPIQTPSNSSSNNNKSSSSGMGRPSGGPSAGPSPSSGNAKPIGRIFTVSIEKGTAGLGLDIGKANNGACVIRKLKDITPNPASACNPPLKGNDVIVGVNGKKVKNFEEVVQIVKSLGTPTVVSLTISREG